MHLVVASPVRSPQRATRSSLLSRTLAVLTALFAVLLITSLTIAPASAHNSLQFTDPADGATLDEAPSEVSLTFDDKVIELGSLISVLSPDGSEVAVGAVAIENNVVTQPLADTLPAGEYTVLWRVTSADGHPIDGEFAFTAETAVSPDEPVEPADDPSTDNSESPEASTEAPESAEPSEAPSSATDSPDITADTTEDASVADNGSNVGLIVAIVIGVAVVAAGVWLLLSRRRQNGENPQNKE